LSAPIFALLVATAAIHIDYPAPDATFPPEITADPPTFRFC
jgi:hypothetical protein